MGCMCLGVCKSECYKQIRLPKRWLRLSKRRQRHAFPCKRTGWGGGGVCVYWLLANFVPFIIGFIN